MTANIFAARIAEGRAATGRSCGTCSLCCKLYTIEEIEKPADKWCQHCKPGNGGCGIYADRPLSCSNFACNWLVMPSMGDEWFPAKSKMVAVMATVGNTTTMRIAVDPTAPGRWREEPYFSQIKEMARVGLCDDLAWTVEVRDGKCHFLVLPNKIVEKTANFYTLFRTGPEEGNVIFLFDDKEASRTAFAAMNAEARI
jgi:hypothetical protein